MNSTRVECVYEQDQNTRLINDNNPISKDALVFHSNPFKMNYLVAYNAENISINSVLAYYPTKLLRVASDEVPPGFLFRLNESLSNRWLATKIEAIMAFETMETQGHLVLFNINGTHLYCTQDIYVNTIQSVLNLNTGMSNGHDSRPV